MPLKNADRETGTKINRHGSLWRILCLLLCSSVPVWAVEPPPEPKIELGGKFSLGNTDQPKLVMTCQRWSEVTANRDQILADAANRTNSLIYPNTESPPVGVKITKKNPTTTFTGTIKFVGAVGRLAIISDDGCTVSVKLHEPGAEWEEVLDKCGHGQALNQAAFETLPFFFKPDTLYDVEVKYSQTYYKPMPGQPDIDGATLYACLLPGEMVPDYNRDGIIDDKDRGKVTETDPWRFWVNDDDDSITSNGFPSTKRDHTTPKVDGAQDLWDFFPVFLDIQQLVKALPPDSNVKYKLKQANGAVNFVKSKLTRKNAFTYRNALKLPDPPALETGFGTNLTQAPYRADTQQVTAEGVELTAEFLNNIKDHNQGVILVEGRTPTTNPLVLTVEKDDVQVAELSLPLALNARILLLLHGMNSNTATWDKFVDQKIGHEPAQWAADIKVDDRRLPKNAPMLTSHGVRCFRLQFGGYEDKDTPRMGVDDLTTVKANAGNYLKDRSTQCGDFETFAQLSQEIDDAIRLLLANPRYDNAQIFLVGHSRGGLAARAFLQNQTQNPGPSTPANRSAVIGLLTTGTPHRGSPIGRIYQWLKANNRTANASDWAVVDRLKAKLEITPPGDGVDVRRPVVEDMADNSTAIGSLNAAVGSLPNNIRYGQIIYRKSALGRLARLVENEATYSVFQNTPNLLPKFSDTVRNFLLGTGRMPTEAGYLGDGLIPSENQKFPQSFLNSHKVSELVVTADDVLHAEEPGRTDDLRSRLHDLMPTWFP